MTVQDDGRVWVALGSDEVWGALHIVGVDETGVAAECIFGGSGFDGTLAAVASRNAMRWVSAIASDRDGSLLVGTTGKEIWKIRPATCEAQKLHTWPTVLGATVSFAPRDGAPGVIASVIDPPSPPVVLVLGEADAPPLDVSDAPGGCGVAVRDGTLVLFRGGNEQARLALPASSSLPALVARRGCDGLVVLGSGADTWIGPLWTAIP